MHFKTEEHCNVSIYIGQILMDHNHIGIYGNDPQHTQIATLIK